MRQPILLGILLSSLLLGGLSQSTIYAAETAPEAVLPTAAPTQASEAEAQRQRDQRVAAPKSNLADAIVHVRQQGLMNAYPDGQFHPERSLTRAELASLLVKTFHLNTREVPNPLPVDLNDVPATHWAARDIETVVSQGIMTGYRPYHFYPNQPVTRAEAYAIFAQAYGVQQLEPAVVNETLVQYADANQVPAWSKKAMATALKNGFVDTLPPAKLRPQQAMTRGNMAIALNQYLIRLNQPEP